MLDSLTREDAPVEDPARILARKMKEDAEKAAAEAEKKRKDELLAMLQASTPAPAEEKSLQEKKAAEAKMSEANRKLKDLLTNPGGKKD